MLQKGRLLQTFSPATAHHPAVFTLAQRWQKSPRGYKHDPRRLEYKLLGIGLDIICGNTPKNKQLRWLDIGNTSHYERWVPVPGLKHPFPCTPGLRNAVLPDRKYYNLWEGPPLKKLTTGKDATNAEGRGGPNKSISVRHRGGRKHNKKVRLVDHTRSIEDTEGIVERLEYDPERSAFIALIRYPAIDNKPQYVIATAETEPGDTIITTRNTRKASDVTSKDFEYDEDLIITKVRPDRAAAIAEILPGHILTKVNNTDVSRMSKEQVMEIINKNRHRNGGNFNITVNRGREGTFKFEDGNSMPLRNCPDKAIVCCIEGTPGKGATYARSAGTYCKILDKGATRDGYALLEMTSKEKRLLPLDSLATLGRVSNIYWNKVVWGRAGVRRRQGWRPVVRGVAMNACDHPHGGGEGKKKTKAGGQRTWKSKMMHGVPTRKKYWGRMPDWMNMRVEQRPRSMQSKSRAANKAANNSRST